MIAETLPIGGVGPLEIERPDDPEALLDEERFEREDEFLPYWAELWPSGRALAAALGQRALHGRRVLELGCGLGLPSLVAARAGARVLATDWAPEALELLRANAERNAAPLATLECDWSAPPPALLDGSWDLVLAADVLYEQRNVAPLLGLLERLWTPGCEIWLADPGRTGARVFLADAAGGGWRVETARQERPRVAIHRMSR